MIKRTKSVKTRIFAAHVQVPPTCQPSRMTQKGSLDVQFLVHLTISMLDLSEINNLYTLELSVVVT